MLTQALRSSPWLAGWLILTGAGSAGGEPGPVVVSELMWAGSSASSSDEWIELYNRGSDTVNLAGWTITRGDGEDESLMVLIESGQLPPGEIFLISNYGHEDERSRLSAAPSLVDPQVSLPNSKLRLRLYDGPPESGALIDLVDDGKGAPFAGLSGDMKAAMVRTDLEAPGDEKSSWTTATAASGWDPGATELGTPGTMPGEQSSTEIPTHVWAVAWGTIKHGL
ncbi:MAG: lamin tail domain-containing protein [Gemmatimonadaceae bacterium]|nr:lamin tail domain-containing protein [Gemmatimonadaceae bacterium]